MKLRLLLLGSMFFSCFNVTLAEPPPSYIPTKDGIIVFTDPLITGKPNAVKLEVVADNIIRVIAVPGKDIPSRQSLVTVYTKRQDLGWDIVPSKERYAGGQEINADAAYERMPVFVKAGSIIPFGPELQYTSEKLADTITLNIYTGADVSFNLYEDEGTNYNYEKGAFSIIPIKYNEASGTITVGDRKGSFNGMLEKRVFKINFISPTKTMTLDFNASDKIITYEGKKLTGKM
ncbi:MAG TPA: DUF5110 domain-containing protein [Chitinophagaceae bacterium]|jgi:hypothetical protein|nr:DUF5110 domain-containing protein [Chitinophagaceae bacterium]